MANVTGRKGNVVKFQVLGVAQTAKMLIAKDIAVKGAISAGIMQAATLIDEEVKESIAGNRAENKSVDTGEFIKSVRISQMSKDSATISSDVPQATFMEYGTSRGILARHHFENTKNRNKDKVEDKIKISINRVV